MGYFLGCMENSRIDDFFLRGRGCAKALQNMLNY
jgi:hypothetical protein